MKGQRAAYVDHDDSLGRTALWFLSKPAVSVLRGCDVQKVLQASSYRSPSPLILRHQQRLFGNRSLLVLMGREWRHYRLAAHKAFSPSAVKNMRGAISAVAKTLCESLKNAINQSYEGCLEIKELTKFEFAVLVVLYVDPGGDRLWD